MPLVVPVPLSQLAALSSVRIYVPRDLRPPDARALAIKVRKRCTQVWLSKPITSPRFKPPLEHGRALPTRVLQDCTLNSCYSAHMPVRLHSSVCLAVTLASRHPFEDLVTSASTHRHPSTCRACPLNALPSGQQAFDMFGCRLWQKLRSASQAASPFWMQRRICGSLILASAKHSGACPHCGTRDTKGRTCTYMHTYSLEITLWLCHQ